MEYVLKKKEMDNSSKPNQTRVRKSYSLYLRVKLQEGVNEVSEDDDEWEPVEPITSPCDSVLGYWGLSAKKSV